MLNARRITNNGGFAMLHISRESRENWNGAVSELRPHEFNGKKWNELFDTEEELIQCTKEIDIEKFKREKHSGWGYIDSFVKRLNSGDELTPKQVTQLKRLASEVFSYTWNKNNIDR